MVTCKSEKQRERTRIIAECTKLFKDTLLALTEEEKVVKMEKVVERYKASSYTGDTTADSFLKNKNLYLFVSKVLLMARHEHVGQKLKQEEKEKEEEEKKRKEKEEEEKKRKEKEAQEEKKRREKEVEEEKKRKEMEAEEEEKRLDKEYENNLKQNKTMVTCKSEKQRERERARIIAECTKLFKDTLPALTELEKVVKMEKVVERYKASRAGDTATDSLPKIKNLHLFVSKLLLMAGHEPVGPKLKQEEKEKEEEEKKRKEKEEDERKRKEKEAQEEKKKREKEVEEEKKRKEMEAEEEEKRLDKEYEDFLAEEEDKEK